MTAPATPPDSAAPPDPKVWARPLHGRHIELLGDLAEEAREVARTLARRVAAVDGDDSLAPVEIVPLLEGLSRAYGRAGRGLRLTLMLRERVIKDLIAFDAGVAQKANAGDPRRDNSAYQIVRVFVDPEDPEEIERLKREVCERLDRETLDDPLPACSARAPAAIRQDCDLDPDGSRLADPSWARDEMTGGEAGWPSAGGRSPADRPSLHKASP